jgi:hypothetical protein
MALDVYLALVIPETYAIGVLNIWGCLSWSELEDQLKSLGPKG